jgi:hypothetical protein
VSGDWLASHLGAPEMRILHGSVSLRPGPGGAGYVGHDTVGDWAAGHIPRLVPPRPPARAVGAARRPGDPRTAVHAAHRKRFATAPVRHGVGDRPPHPPGLPHRSPRVLRPPASPTARRCATCPPPPAASSTPSARSSSGASRHLGAARPQPRCPQRPRRWPRRPRHPAVPAVAQLRARFEPAVGTDHGRRVVAYCCGGHRRVERRLHPAAARVSRRRWCTTRRRRSGLRTGRCRSSPGREPIPR